MKLKELSAVVAMISLAACGGSGTPSVEDIDVEDVITFTNLTIADLADLEESEIEELVEEFEEEVDALDLTDLTALDASGTLNYSGLAAVAEAERDEFGDISTDVDIDDALAFGEISLSIALADDSITGSISEIRNTDEGDEISGSLDISGELRRDIDLEDFFGISGDISGTLTDAEDGEFTVDTDLAADLFGSDAEFVAGNGVGSAQFEDGSVDIVIGFGLEADD